MGKRCFENALAIGLVAQEESASAHIRSIVETGTLSISFQATVDEIENGRQAPEVNVVVVVGTLQHREDSDFNRVFDRFSETRLVVCTEPVEPSTIRWVMERGADGLVWDTQLDEAFELTVRAVHAGQLVFPRDFRRKTQTPDLTNREKQALSLVIMGFTNHEIAQKLFLSENTVKSHLNGAFRKLGVHSRAEAQRVITDPDEGFGTGILAITAPGLARGRRPRSGQTRP